MLIDLIGFMPGSKRYIFPLSENDAALKHAIQMAQYAGATLYILHTYRITEIDPNIQRNGNNSIKKSYDEIIEQRLNEKFGEQLNQAGIKYEFLIEIGFLTDRLLANIKEKKIQFLLLDHLASYYDEIDLNKFQEVPIEISFISSVEDTFLDVRETGT